MLRNRIDSWLRFSLILLTFWAVLWVAQSFFGAVAGFDTALTERAVQTGYIVSLRGISLLLVLIAAFVMAALLRRGLLIAPLVWILVILRFSLGSAGLSPMKNLLFVSNLYNLLLLILVPIILAILLWQALERLDPEFNLGRFAMPGLWVLFVVLIQGGNYFVWRWSNLLAAGSWSPSFSLIYVLFGLSLFLFTAGHNTWQAPLAYYGGLLMPLGVLISYFGWYEGLNLFLAMSLPFAGSGFFNIWLELMIVVALPLILMVAIKQFLNWRRGRPLIRLL